MKKISIVLSIILIVSFMAAVLLWAHTFLFVLDDADAYINDDLTYNSDPEPKPGDINISFDERTGTLTISGNGAIKQIYASFLDDDLHTVDHTNNDVKHLIIEEGITEIYDAFDNMNALKDIQLPSTLIKMELAFEGCKVLESVTIPEGVISLQRSFNKCPKLKKVEFEGEGNIRFDTAFCYTGVEEVYIPDNSDLYYAFNDCQNLKKVVFGNNVRVHDFTLNADHLYSFNGCNEELVIYVARMTTQYQKALTYAKLEVYNPVVNWLLIIWCANAVLLVPLIIYLKRKQKKS